MNTIFLIFAVVLAGFAFTSILFTVFKNHAMPNPEEADSYIKATSGKLPQDIVGTFTVHMNKKVAS